MFEIIILVGQLLLFYLLPLFLGSIDPMAMVLMIILGTVILSILLSCLSKNKIKYLYPVVIAVLFIPSVFVFYNESALVHSLWYLVISFITIGITCLIKWLFKRFPIVTIVSFVFILILTVIFCFPKSDMWMIGDKSGVNIVDKGISLSVVENTVTETSAKLILKNDNGNDITFGEYYEIEVFQEDEWHKINVEVSFIEIAYLLKPSDSFEFNLDWGEIYGKLPSGKYRIIKEVYLEAESLFISAEFDI